MADKKNILIKVKYPNAGKLSKDEISPPKTITEWNIKRIVIAVAIILLVITSIVLLISNDSSTVAKDQEISTEAPTPNNSPAIQKTENKTGAVLRALLTTKVVNNEPVDELPIPLKVSKKGSTWIYYFVELNAMKGKTVYHEWLLDGQLISRKKVTVADDIWRTSSRQVFKLTSQTNWTVRLVDEAGEKISEKYFNVNYE
jgi:hypothetical protein